MFVMIVGKGVDDSEDNLFILNFVLTYVLCNIRREIYQTICK